MIPSNETVINNNGQEEEPKVTTKPPIATRKPPTATKPQVTTKSSPPRAQVPAQTIPGKQASGHSITEQKDTGSTQIQKPTPPPPPQKDETSEF